MLLPLQITFRGMEPSEAIAADIRQRAAKLDEFYDRVTSCRVVVEVPHRHHHHGKLYHVRVEVIVPGRELVVSRAPGEHHAHEDAHVAIRDAIDAVARQLADYVRERRGQTKHHEPPPGSSED